MPLLLAAALASALPSSVPERDARGKPSLRSESVVVRLADTGAVVLEKNPTAVRPIASVTKLLSGLVLSHVPVDPTLLVTIGEEDKDRRKWSRSRLYVGLSALWGELIQAALGASDNRAMYASVRAAMPRSEFVERMNRLAAELGMSSSHFVDPAGIDPGNVSTARDLLQLLARAAEDERVRGWALTHEIDLATRRGTVTLRNPDRLVYSGSWDVIVGKTGYTVEAGRTLALRARIQGRTVDMVFLGSREMASVFGDASRVRRWLEPQLAHMTAAASTDGAGGQGAVATSGTSGTAAAEAVATSGAPSSEAPAAIASSAPNVAGAPGAVATGPATPAGAPGSSAGGAQAAGATR